MWRLRLYRSEHLRWYHTLPLFPRHSSPHNAQALSAALAQVFARVHTCERDLPFIMRVLLFTPETSLPGPLSVPLILSSSTHLFFMLPHITTRSLKSARSILSTCHTVSITSGLWTFLLLRTRVLTSISTWCHWLVILISTSLTQTTLMLSLRMRTENVLPPSSHH